MSKFINIFAAFALLLMLSSCKKEKAFDASGSFEAVEIIISAEASGVIKQLNIQEGQIINAGDTIGYIDSVQIFLKKKQLLAQLKATGKRMPNITNQTAFYNAQESVSKSRLQNLGKEKKRIENLLKAEAGYSKTIR
jgi:HlyD family secretion protein